jgi:hypothetical protein
MASDHETEGAVGSGYWEFDVWGTFSRLAWIMMARLKVSQVFGIQLILGRNSQF